MHFVLRCIVRIPLAVSSVLVAIITFVFGFLLVPFLVSGILELLELLSTRHDYDTFINIVIFVGSLGLYTSLVNKHFQEIRSSLSRLLSDFAEVMRLPWIPVLEIRESLTTTWKQITDTYPKFRETAKSSVRLVQSILLLAVLFALMFHTDFIEAAKFQSYVENKLETIEKYQAEFRTSQINMIGKMEVMANQHADLAEKFDKHEKDSASGTEDPASPSPGPSEQVHVMYQLVYPPHGDLDTKNGICPDGQEYHSLEWLGMFKPAVRQCAGGEERLKLEVAGFSSIAPVAMAGGHESSGLLNCEIANQRAEAVVGFLIEEEYHCEEFLRSSLWERPENKLCTRKMDEYRFGREHGLPYDITYRPWQNHEKMEQSRPVNDGTLGGDRRYPSEFLNRGVQITVNNDTCWRDQWKQRIINRDN